MAFYADFAGYYEQIFPFREPTLAFLKTWLPDAGPVLDIGCGTGGYCGHLSTDGRRCLGVDLDPHMIRAAEETYPTAEFSILDMASVGRLAPQQFSGIYCIGNVLAHLPTAELSGFLSDLHSLLQPGGVWIFQTVNFDFLQDQDTYTFPVRDFPADDLHFHRRYEADGQGRMLFQTRLVRKSEEIFAGEVTLYPRTAAQCLECHLAAGFSLEGHFGDYAGAPFDPDRSAAGIFVFRRVG